jgi:alginate O-acetyltransferase complex protein AlgI
MVFSSFLFLFYFLPVVLGVYFLSPRALRNVILVLASVFFYAWGEPRFTVTLLILCFIDYCAAILIDKSVGVTRKWFLTVSLLINAASLAYFKYSNFFIHEWNRVLEQWGFPDVAWTKVALPIGVSFFTFHKISYVVDVYRRIQKPARNVIDYALYILFFPQLISGPIVRYHEIADQIQSRSVKLDDLFEGISRFSRGLAKKVLVADVVGHVADTMFGLSPSALTPSYAWLGMVAYTAQIYFDFSGYSDMAIGLARIFGFRFPENFDNPYLARSFTDFWRRWHMSFGRWMREYLYYPLGGSRYGTFRTYVNLWVVFLFSGLWHGAEWTFILWGVYHGVFMTIERLFLEKRLTLAPIWFQTLFTLFFVMLSRVLFRAESLAEAGTYYSHLVSSSEVTKIVPIGNIVSTFELCMVVMAYVICLWPLLLKNSNERPTVYSFIPNLAVSTAWRGACAVLLLFLSVTAMAGTDFSPFIYFQF